MGYFFTSGLHRLPASNELNPLTEFRNSLSTSLYLLDKMEGIFSARPPSLTRFYCTYRIPLDLSEDDLYGSPETLQAAVSNLDDEGWNTSGAIHISTVLRARCLLTPIWEELLEMTLGVNTQVTSERIEYYSTFPCKTKYSILEHL
jgi:hypothetical protein